MKLALIGHGKVGRVVEEVARERRVEVVACYTSSHPLRADEATRRQLEGVSALVDFSAPEAVPGTVAAAAELGHPLVIGTTGWLGQLAEVRQRVESAGLGVVWAANFSIGTHIFYRAVEEAARLFAALEGYDPFIEEWHHKFKKDSPSGTALELRRRMARHYGERDIPLTCLRAGYIPSIHSVGFDSEADSVHLEHRARNRRGFAEGALLAVKWIAGRRGFYEFPEVLADLYPRGGNTV